MLRGPDARLRFVNVLMIAVLLPILGQLVRLQVLERSRRLPEVEELLQRPYTLPAPPPGIVMDAHGELLVGNVPIYKVGAEISRGGGISVVGNVTRTRQVAEELAPLLNRDSEELFQALSVPPDAGGRVWRPLAAAVPADVGEQLMQLRSERWGWLTLEMEWQRYYAEGDLASHTLGFVTEKDKDGQQGGFGVQGYYVRLLSPLPVVGRGEVDAYQVPLAEALALGELRAYPGTDLVLTLDRTIQAFVEGELDWAMQEYRAQGGTILVLNPRTGAILAAASRPAYVPYEFGLYPESEYPLFQDPVVSSSYEPGSVFKVLTVAAAVDAGGVGPNWSYHDSGYLEYGGVPIRNSDHRAHGQQNLQGLLDSSLNVGAATLTTRVLGAESFYRYMRAFGFGQKTGVDLVGESTGILHFPESEFWSDSSLATNSFGQGIAVTPVQLMTAVSALANRGTMMVPYVVAERRYPDGRLAVTTPRPLGTPITPETADYLAELMEKSVAHRLTRAQVPGYRIAGKTGTSQIPIPGGYHPVDVITSFIGFGPMPDPEVLILVKIDRPGIERHLRWGTQTAAPTFSRVAERLFVLMGIPPSEVWAGP